MKPHEIIIYLREYDNPILQEAANLIQSLQPRPIEEAQENQPSHPIK